MGYKYLNNTELEEALKNYMSIIKANGITRQTEEVNVKDSLDRVTSEAVYANISSPHYNACAMDGIAVVAKNTFGATDTTPVELTESVQFVRVDTGDPLPDGFDAVVMVEDVIDAGDGKVKVFSAVSPWQHIRQIGEDICAGEMLLPSNTRIEPAAVGALLAGGVLRVKVWKHPVVGIIPTGDEVVSPTANPEKGQIIEFNSSIFTAMLTRWGAEARVYGIVPDRFNLIKEAVLRASRECDIVVLNAGSSAGREDYSAKVIEEAGALIGHGIAIKPGKPTILGVVNDRPVVGVPGYPVSGIIVMDKIVRLVIEAFTGSVQREKKVEAVLSRKLVSSLKYKEFIRVKLGSVGDRLIATPLSRGAGVVTSFVKADGILEVPMNCEGCESGQKVIVQLLKDEEEIANTLVITGSHDPLLDVAADIMRKEYTGAYIASAHVGSMGGIMAVKRKEAHLAGIHLLDENTGEYNTSFVKKYFPDEKIMLVRGVKRLQGIMVASGNPKAINSLTDICRENISYVNRQKGSGTRILLDYLLKKDNISPSEIYGYDREEFTHLSVAALVASGSADAGMGILAAAKIYGLDFIPLYEEQYDFILREAFLDTTAVRNFIDILKSQEFNDALSAMGGYVVEAAGDLLD